MHYGQQFVVTTPNAASIRKVTLIRLAATTHTFDMGQRLNTLTFQVARRRAESDRHGAGGRQDRAARAVSLVPRE